MVIDSKDFHSHFKVHLLVHNLVMIIKPQSLFIYELCMRKSECDEEHSNRFVYVKLQQQQCLGNVRQQTKMNCSCRQTGGRHLFRSCRPKIEFHCIKIAKKNAHIIGQKRENVKNVDIVSTNIPLSGAASILSGQLISGIILFQMSSSSSGTNVVFVMLSINKDRMPLNVIFM